ncbi:MAG: hypothetical protein AAGJ83_07980, partial [Planctomycetota bacterium]
ASGTLLRCGVPVWSMNRGIVSLDEICSERDGLSSLRMHDPSSSTHWRRARMAPRLSPSRPQGTTMRFSQSCVSVVLIAALFGVGIYAQSNAQTDETLKPPKVDESVPEAALLTERGRQLANELKMLQRTRDTLGPKHPTLPIVEQKIKDVLGLLSAWEPKYGESDNPFRKGEASDRVEMMNEYDLRQVVLRLSKRVDELEKRVATLEGAK